MGGESGTPAIPYCRSLSLLGERVAGTLYAADSDRYGGAVTVTVYPRQLDAQGRQQFDAAVEAARRLGAHPNIVTVHAGGHTDGDTRPYVVSDGHDRATAQGVLATSGVFDLDAALRLGVALSGALETAHRLGVVHGGVSPEVVLLRPDGQPVLTEVALSAFSRPQGASAALARWIPYHAPPEILEDTDLSPATDVYSLASVVYTLLVGQPPHARTGADDSTASLLLRILQMPVPAIGRPGVPAGLEDALRAALSHSPAKRPQHALELGWTLQEAQRRAGVEVTEPVALDLAGGDAGGGEIGGLAASGAGGRITAAPAGPLAASGAGGGIAPAVAGPLGGDRTSRRDPAPTSWADSQTPFAPAGATPGPAGGHAPLAPPGGRASGQRPGALGPPTSPGPPWQTNPAPGPPNGRMPGAGDAGGPAGNGAGDPGASTRPWWATPPHGTPRVGARPPASPTALGTAPAPTPPATRPAVREGHGDASPGPDASSTRPWWATPPLGTPAVRALAPPLAPAAPGGPTGFGPGAGTTPPPAGLGPGTTPPTSPGSGSGIASPTGPNPGHTAPPAGLGPGTTPPTSLGRTAPPTSGGAGTTAPPTRPWWATPPNGIPAVQARVPEARPPAVPDTALGPVNHPIGRAPLADALPPGLPTRPAAFGGPPHRPLPSRKRAPVDGPGLGGAVAPGDAQEWPPSSPPDRQPRPAGPDRPALPEARQGPAPATGRSPRGRRRPGDQPAEAGDGLAAGPQAYPGAVEDRPGRTRRTDARDRRHPPAGRPAGGAGTGDEPDAPGAKGPWGSTGFAGIGATDERATSALERARQARLERQRRAREAAQEAQPAPGAGDTVTEVDAATGSADPSTGPPAVPVIILLVVLVVLGIGGAWMVINGEDTAKPATESRPRGDGASPGAGGSAPAANRASDLTAVETAEGVQLDWEGPADATYVIRILSPTEQPRSLPAGPATAVLLPLNLVQPGGAYCFDVVSAPADGDPPVSAPAGPSAASLPTACIGGAEPQSVIRP